MSESEFDTTDIDRWIDVPLGGGTLKDPIHVNDIRRWAQGMQNPNPLYYDDEYAAAGRFGEIVAQTSSAVWYTSTRLVCIHPVSPPTE